MPQPGAQILTPVWATTDGEMVRLYHGHVLDVLAKMKSKSVHCVISSPPYWNLRSYVDKGDENKRYEIGTEPAHDCLAWARGEEPCAGCFVCSMRKVFKRLHRVLRDDGTAWLNLGDTILSDGNLAGVPWRTALALQADGWILRSDMPWVKGSAMPESVKNRPSKSLEYIFLFCKARWVQNRESTLPKRISFEDARWLALLFDTEGNICARRHQRPDGKTQYGSQISVGMTSIALLNRAREIVGVGSLNERPGCNAPMYQWQLVARQASDLLRIIHPHLIVKRRQAQLVIHFQSLLRHRGNACRRTVEEEEELVRLWQMNKQLNHFGNPDMSGIPEPIELSRFGRWESQDYFCDMEAVKKSGKGGWSSASFLPDSAKDAANNGTPTAATGASRSNRSTDLVEEGTGRNYRNSDLWFESISAPHGVVGVGDEMVGTNVNPTGYGGAHFAVFSSKLIEPFIKMGTSERGVCAECGAPYRRLIKEEIIEKKPIDHSQRAEWDRSMDGALGDFNGQKGLRDGYEIKRTKTMGWEKTCQCSTLDTVPATVLDPFMGSGTTSVVSLRLGRRSIGIDLSLDYILKNQVPRIRGELASIPELRHLDPDRKVQRVSGGTSLLRKPQ